VCIGGRNPSLGELLRKHGQTPKLKKREEVRQRIERGEPVAQIARAMRITRSSVYNHMYMLHASVSVSEALQRVKPLLEQLPRGGAFQSPRAYTPVTCPFGSNVTTSS
jgi:DNA-binding CsgD family transcriptional regulator